MRAVDVADYLEKARYSEPEDSFWCRKISIPLLNCLLNHSIIDRTLSVVIAGGAAAIAYKHGFLEELFGERGGKAAAVFCNLVANTAIFLDFRLSDGLVRGIRAERRLRTLSSCVRYPILTAWWGSTLILLPSGVIAQACLTGEGLPRVPQIILAFLGGLGFLATRGATFSRLTLHFTVDPDAPKPSSRPPSSPTSSSSSSSYPASDFSINPPLPASWGHTMLEYCLPLGSRSNLPWDEKIVDVLSSACTLSFMVAGRWVWTDMYRLKLVKGLLDLGLDLCGDQGCNDGYLYYVTSLLSCLSYFYFYFPAQDAAGHFYRFCKGLFNYLEKTGCPQWAILISLMVSLFLIGTCGLGSETGLVFSRVLVGWYLAEIYFFLVNTPSLLKKLAEYLISKVVGVDNSEHPTLSFTGYSLNSSSAHRDLHGLKKPLMVYSSIDIKEKAKEVKEINMADQEIPEKEKSCCNIFRVWGRIKERYYGTSTREPNYSAVNGY